MMVGNKDKFWKKCFEIRAFFNNSIENSLIDWKVLIALVESSTNLVLLSWQNFLPLEQAVISFFSIQMSVKIWSQGHQDQAEDQQNCTEKFHFRVFACLNSKNLIRMKVTMNSGLYIVRFVLRTCFLVKTSTKWNLQLLSIKLYFKNSSFLPNKQILISLKKKLILFIFSSPTSILHKITFPFQTWELKLWNISNWILMIFHQAIYNQRLQWFSFKPFFLLVVVVMEGSKDKFCRIIIQFKILNVYKTSKFPLKNSLIYWEILIALVKSSWDLELGSWQNFVSLEQAVVSVLSV